MSYKQICMEVSGVLPSSLHCKPVFVCCTAEHGAFLYVCPRDGTSNAVAMYGTSSSSTAAQAEASRQQPQPSSSTQPRPVPAGTTQAGERVMRTVFLPMVDADFLMLKMESLQAQLNEQVHVAELLCCMHTWYPALLPSLCCLAPAS